MPKDTPNVSAPKPMTLKDVLADMEQAQGEPIELGDLPPLYVAEEIRRTVRTLPVPDLASLSKLWMLIGEGNTGKTKVARYLVEMLIQHGKIEQSMIAALAAGNRNLTHFAPGALQPPSSDPAATAAWATKHMQAMQKLRFSGVWDFGGGDSSLRMAIQAQPDIAERSEQEGLAIVAAYLFSPRLDDLVFLKAFERMGFRPRATALILNLGKADSPAAFNDLRRQPEFKAALDRGAVEIWLPPLRQNVALAIEKSRVLFSQARDGDIPADKRAPDVSPTERVLVREWLLRIEAEFSVIEKAGWMPWI